MTPQQKVSLYEGIYMLVGWVAIGFLVYYGASQL